MADPIAVISTFPVAADQQADLLRHLHHAAENVLRFRPGFVAARLLCAADGTAVVNYAEWVSEQAIRDALADPLVRASMAPAWAIARPQVRRSTVASVHRRS